MLGEVGKGRPLGRHRRIDVGFATAAEEDVRGGLEYAKSAIGLERGAMLIDRSSRVNERRELHANLLEDGLQRIAVQAVYD